MQICGVVGAHRSGAELSFIKWYYTSHISKIKIKLKSVCWSIESITLTVYSLGFFLYKKTVASKCAITAIFFVFAFFVTLLSINFISSCHQRRLFCMRVYFTTYCVRIWCAVVARLNRHMPFFCHFGKFPSPLYFGVTNSILYLFRVQFSIVFYYQQ